jgi:hypothetical protein
MNNTDQSTLPACPSPVLPAAVTPLTDADPQIFHVFDVVTDPSSPFPLAVTSAVPPEIYDLARLIRTEPNSWQVYSGWSNLGVNPADGLVFQCSVSRPVQVRFALRFPNHLLGSAMSLVHRAGGFTLSYVAPDLFPRGHRQIRQIITFVVDPNVLLDTLAQLRPSAAS